MPISIELKIKKLLVELRKLKKAYNRLLRSVPNPQEAEHAADIQFRIIQNLLEDPDVASLIEAHIAAVKEQVATPEFDIVLKKRQMDVTQIEMRLSQAFGLRRKDLGLMYEQFSKAKDSKDEFVIDMSQVRDRLIKAHILAKDEIKQLAETARKKKKKRKRNIGQGVTSAILGTVVIASNTKLPIVFAFSYGLGGGALHQAVRDIVGTSE